jgi:small-conductance mechanosensitive channel
MILLSATLTNQINHSINDTLGNSNTWRIFGIFVVAFIVATLIGNIFAKILVWIAQAVAVKADASSIEERNIQLRRVETYLSVITAILRGLIMLAGAYIALRIIAPQSSGLLTTIGAGTVFAVIAAGTVSPLVRDIAYGALMIIERWYSVGDFIRVIPFSDVAGVVERVTLRATKLRNINGDVIWVHNQYIQGVRTTPRGVRTLALDIFVRDQAAGLELIEAVAKTLPISPTMLVHPIEITAQEKLSLSLWRIEVTAQTAPGREWLVEDFMVQNLREADDQRDDDTKVISYGPIVHNADTTAEKRYRRAVGANRETAAVAKKKRQHRSN